MPRNSGGHRSRQSLARQADKYRLYETAVQSPEAEVAFVQRVFRKRVGRPARRLREDFCGTAALACAWVRAHRENRAWGVDIDPTPLAWGRAEHIAALSPEQRGRIQLVEADVRQVRTPRADVIVALNFSYLVLRRRDELLSYLQRARASLDSGGVLMLDAYGGPDAHQTMREEWAHDGFDYVWEQASFDPIHHEATNYIHFEFPDGSALRRAFRYEWRLWTLPELRDLLCEAGFTRSEVYWEGRDTRTGNGNGVYRRTERAPDDPAWVAYIVATR